MIWTPEKIAERAYKLRVGARAPVRVVAAPDAERLRVVRQRMPDALVVSECAPGDELWRFDVNQGSYLLED